MICTAGTNFLFFPPRYRELYIYTHYYGKENQIQQVQQVQQQQ